MWLISKIELEQNFHSIILDTELKSNNKVSSKLLKIKFIITWINNNQLWFQTFIWSSTILMKEFNIPDQSQWTLSWNKTADRILGALEVLSSSSVTFIVGAKRRYKGTVFMSTVSLYSILKQQYKMKARFDALCFTAQTSIFIESILPFWVCFWDQYSLLL